MQKPLTVLLVSSMLLASCGSWSGSRLNPGNWFGKSRSERVQPVEETNPLIPATQRGMFSRPEKVDMTVPIAEVTELRVEQTSTGVIIYAEGLATRQGPYEVELRPVTTPEEEAEGILSLSFRVVYPERPTRVGTDFSRTVRAAHSMTKQEIGDIREVRVAGEANVRSTRRR
ncbi:hypothetical protein [Antarcticimicrobium sediminis]|uniref:Lipoprotein n=1 Tax=Antarcticimicrobium sediminis TaxID=2546227 RepID=A0A4R5ELI2_9RHOB|nr:hypothetical protein [Antarcticimicrobium sediminis]TDE35220.1 hypothetical protein E1B25_17580 [Antarcticimicrobium sediminis]